jgi:hypothetical protein
MVPLHKLPAGIIAAGGDLARRAAVLHRDAPPGGSHAGP